MKVVGYKHRAKIIWEELNRDYDFNNDKEDIKFYARYVCTKDFLNSLPFSHF